ncbi:hypothetical protein [Asticcacaulis sp. EMRT-3]|uniref:hypothetical protein n=1 Tax=Asticcacaulis sp. EMRT-3 TaxID=3040349 RepID=UPI0024AF88F2|nr:hypothetical protein [Asticcacaulis sp. EMRT-3]MDI7774424.1 hypothetical protein [Asticcacaulis sp. EMRT-3]
MTFSTLFASYWWLIFPIGGMLMGVFAMSAHFHHRNETLKLIKSYADQGKDPPAALLEAIRSDEDRAYELRGRYGRHGRYGPWGVWRKVVIWSALAAGFSYAGHYSHLGENNAVFTALGVAFGVAAVASLVWALISTFTMPRA